MKKIFIYFAIVALLSTTACEDFLTVRPVGVVDEEGLLTEQGLDWMITGMYSSLYLSTQNSTLANFTYGDVVGGDFNKGSEANDQPDWGALELFLFTGTNSYISRPYTEYYNGVFKANVVLDMASKMLDKGEITEAEKAVIDAQAKFIRGIWYFELIKLYGPAVPWVGLEEYQSAVNPLVSNVDESGAYIYIWDNLFADFQYAMDNLPETWDASNIGRPNSWAAAAYLAKAKMFRSSPYNGTYDSQDLWGEVKTLLEDIMTEGVTSNGLPYDLHDNYFDLFTAGSSDNLAENVFEIQQVLVGTSTSGNTLWGAGSYRSMALIQGGWGFTNPSQDHVQSYMVDADGLPLLGGGYRNEPAVSQRVGATTTISTDLDVYMDPRIDMNVGRFGVPFFDWDVPTSFDGYIRDVSNGGIYYPKKHMPRKEDQGTLSSAGRGGGTSTTKNFHLIRYAEILLWYAETLINTGDPDGARQYVNQVRERAANSYEKHADVVDGTVTLTPSAFVMDNQFTGTAGTDAAGNYRLGPWPASQFDTEEEAYEALRAEYRAELGGEGRRWYDLTRWGIATEELNAYADYEGQFLTRYQSAVYNDKFVCMPLPFDQIVTMDPLLVQTENWQ